MKLKITSAHARATDPETSHQAASSVVDLRRSQWEVFCCFKRMKKMTDEQLVRDYELMSSYKQSDSGLRTRRKELVDQGLLVDTGERGTLLSGRNAIVWGLADEQ